jgi:FtsX-like permease family/MacB-like periplasmic core domain
VTAIWTRARSELRAGRRSLIGLSLILGLICGVVLTAAEGARRTGTAYPRFLAAIRSPDVFAISGNDPTGPIPVIDLRKVLRLPQVQQGELGKSLAGVAESMQGAVLWSGELNLNGPPTQQAIQQFGYEVKLLAGRLPDPSNPHEVAVGYREHPDPRMRIGDRIRIALVKPDIDESVLFNGVTSKQQLLPPITVRIVGETLQEGELQGSHDLLLTPAFYQRYTPTTFTLPVFAGVLKHGLADFPAFSDAVDHLSPGALVFSQGDEITFVNRSTHLLAVALWLFAGIMALTGLLIFGQALARYSYDEAEENPALLALGMTRQQLFGLTMLRSSIVAVCGAAIGIVIAFLASPLTPFGRLARVAEPHPGFSFDTLILLAGGAALAVAVALLAAIPAWKAATVRGDMLGMVEPRGASHPSRVADGLARAGLSPAGTTGVRMAVQPGRGRTSTPIRVTVFGAALSIAALATAFTFGASFQHLFETPRLYGNDWSFTAGNPYISEKGAGQVLRILQADPNLGAIGEADIREFLQLGSPDHLVRVNAFAFKALRGRIGPTIQDGREPQALDEIALGAKTMRALGVSVGDRIRVSGGRNAETMRVVGTAVLPVAFGPGLAEGATLTLDALRQFVPGAVANGFAARVLPGHDVDAEIAKLNQQLAPTGGNAQAPLEGTNLSSLRRIQSLPFLLAGLLGLAALATLAHTLVTSVRKRRRDFAVLKTLGFVRRQVSAAVAWQATTIGILAVAIGIPIGIALGRWGWNVFSSQVGVVPEPVSPFVFALLLLPATIIFANLVAAVPARIAGRLHPAPVLRTE